VLKEILQKRIGTLPPQDESGEEDEDEFMDPDTMVQGGDGITQIANPPTCPNCLSSNVFRGEIVLLGSDSKLALKSMPIRDREVDEMTVEYSEVVGLGCNDCGHVFLMLKEHG
jgi:hypothetical protein